MRREETANGCSIVLERLMPRMVDVTGHCRRRRKTQDKSTQPTARTLTGRACVHTVQPGQRCRAADVAVHAGAAGKL